MKAEDILNCYLSGKRIVLEKGPLFLFGPYANHPPRPSTLRGRTVTLDVPAHENYCLVYYVSPMFRNFASRVHACLGLNFIDMWEALEWCALRQRWRPFRALPHSIPSLVPFFSNQRVYCKAASESRRTYRRRKGPRRKD